MLDFNDKDLQDLKNQFKSLNEKIKKCKIKILTDLDAMNDDIVRECECTSNGCPGRRINQASS